MKLRFPAGMLSAAACILLLAGSAAAQGGELVKAEWGIPGHRVDVTARVRTFFHDGVLQFEVTRFNLGIDPVPHQNKDLVLRIRRWNGEVEDFSYPERSTINLELDPPGGYERVARRDDDDHDRDHDHEREHDWRDDHHEHGLRILRAYYGAEGQFVNVTDAVQGRVDHGRLFLHVDNFALGVDPLPGRRKVLRVLYSMDGDRRSVMAEEKTDLQLP